MRHNREKKGACCAPFSLREGPPIRRVPLAPSAATCAPPHLVDNDLALRFGPCLPHRSVYPINHPFRHISCARIACRELGMSAASWRHVSCGAASTESGSNSFSPSAAPRIQVSLVDAFRAPVRFRAELHQIPLVRHTICAPFFQNTGRHPPTPCTRRRNEFWAFSGLVHKNGHHPQG